jgi:hypothetical protein
MRIAYPLVSPRRRIYLICDRLHLRLVRKCPNSSPERCDGACKHLRPKSARTINRPVPSQGRIVPFPPFWSVLERVPPFGFLRLPERARASIRRVQRLMHVEIQAVFRPKPLHCRVESRFVTLDTATLSLPAQLWNPGTYGSHSLVCEVPFPNARRGSAC